MIAAVALAGLVAVLRDKEGWSPWAATLLAPSGLLGYLAFVAAAPAAGMVGSPCRAGLGLRIRWRACHAGQVLTTAPVCCYAFVLLLPVAIAFGAWFGSDALIVWRYAI
ncbi:MAG: hypothetical protein M3228_14680 [Actinomycetota bacterium]|nr:hypothetical protein [Actinomycetota bacterium]